MKCETEEEDEEENAKFEEDSGDGSDEGSEDEESEDEDENEEFYDSSASLVTDQNETDSMVSASIFDVRYVWKMNFICWIHWWSC